MAPSRALIKSLLVEPRARGLPFPLRCPCVRSGALRDPCGAAGTGQRTAGAQEEAIAWINDEQTLECVAGRWREAVTTQRLGYKPGRQLLG